MNARTIVIMVMANALLTVALFLGYTLWMAPAGAPRLAVLDVGELYRLKEVQVTAVLTKQDATAEERAGALKAAGTFGTEVMSLLQGLREECRCLILARGAVVGEPGALRDLTPDVRRRLGL